MSLRLSISRPGCLHGFDVKGETFISAKHQKKFLLGLIRNTNAVITSNTCETSRKAVVFNMDPANEKVPYEAAVDIADLVNAEKVAAELSLGPNGSLLYAMEFLEKNMAWLEKKIAEHKEDYVLFDFPGQIELYTHNDCIRNIVQKLLKKGHRVRPKASERKKNASMCSWMLTFFSHVVHPYAQLTAVNLVDSHYCADSPKFIAVMLTSVTLMLQLEMPAVNVLSKIDLIEEYGQLRKYTAIRKVI